MVTQYKTTPGLGFLLGGASSSDDESSLLDSAAGAAAGFTWVGLTGAGLTGAYQDTRKQLLSCLHLIELVLHDYNLHKKDFQEHAPISIIYKYGQTLWHTLAGSSSSESEELSSLLLSCFF